MGIHLKEGYLNACCDFFCPHPLNPKWTKISNKSSNLISLNKIWNFSPRVSSKEKERNFFPGKSSFNFLQPFEHKLVLSSYSSQKSIYQTKDHNYRHIGFQRYLPGKKKSPVVLNPLVTAHPVSNRPVAWFPG